MLRRTKASPLSLRTRLGDDTPAFETIRPVLEEVHRIQELHLRLDHDDDHQAFANLIGPILKQARLLKSLIYHGPQCGIFESPLLSDPFLADPHVPQLERLELRNCNVSWATILSSFTQLRILAMDTTRSEGHRGLLETLEKLGRMSRLETLDIMVPHLRHDGLPHGAGETFWTQRSVIHLPDLKHLKLGSIDTYDIIHFLARIHYSPQTSLDLRCFAPGHELDVDDLAGYLSYRYLTFPGPPLCSIIAQFSPEDISFLASTLEEDISLPLEQAQDSSCSEGSIAIRHIKPPRNEDDDGFLDEAFSVILRAFPIETVEHFAMSPNVNFTRQVEWISACHEALRRMPNLRRLGGRGGSIADLLDVLSSDGMPSVDGCLLAPNLETLVLMDVASHWNAGPFSFRETLEVIQLVRTRYGSAIGELQIVESSQDDVTAGFWQVAQNLRDLSILSGSFTKVGLFLGGRSQNIPVDDDEDST